MKPLLSHLSCLDYWVVGLSLMANPDFDADKPTDLAFEDIEIDDEAIPDKDGRIWTVCLHVGQQMVPGKNAPYSFSIGIQGRFEVLDGYGGNAEWLVRTNGPSMLFGTAREILRTMMKSGPHDAMLLPTVSFYRPPQEDAPPPPPSPPAPKKRTRRRKRTDES